MNRLGEEYDERQILSRGKAYCYAFIAALIAISLTAIITQAIGLKLDGDTVFKFEMWTPITVCLITIIMKDAFDGIRNGASSGVAVGFCLGGVFIMVLIIADIINGNETIMEDDTLNTLFGDGYCALCMLSIGITYWIKKRINKKKFSGE